KTVKGQVTGNTVAPTPASAISLSIMTIKAASTSVSVSSIPIAQTVIAGASQFTFAQYVFDGTASGEDVRLTAVPLAFGVHSGGTQTDLTNCRLYDGTTVVTTGGNVVNPTTSSASSTSYTFDGTGITIPKGTAKTVTLKCDVRSGATAAGQFAWGIDSGGSYSGFTGLVSGQSVVPTINDSTGQYMTVAAGGTLNVVLDTNSPPYKIVNSGATNVELARLKLSAASEDIDLRQIALQLTGVASNTPVDLVGRKVTLWTTGGVQVGEVNFPTGDTGTSSSIALNNFRVPRDGANVLVVKGDIAGIAVSGPLTRSGDLLAVDYDGGNEGLNGTYGVGVASGATIGDTAAEITGGDTASNGVRVMKAYPELAKIDLSTSERVLQGVAQKTLYKFSVKATGGDVALYKFSFDVGSSTVSATTSVYGAYVYTTSDFSSEDTTFSSTGLLNGGNCVNGKVSTDPNDLIIETYMDKTGCNQATTTYIIGSGQTRWFKFNATVSSVRTTTGSETVSYTLLGDAAYSVNASTLMEKAVGVDGDTNDDFLWSPISTTTQNLIGDLDFTNGYQVKGLPGVQMTPETLSVAI
ncbi:MAG: hypothetical protein Q8Q97_00110, partial [bacterium]|nr:hypothetical protein [bacterium]